MKTKIKASFTKPALFDPDVLAYLETRHQNYVIVPIDKARDGFAFICKKFYISKNFSEAGDYNNIQSNFTNSKANFSRDDIIKDNENYCQKFDLKLTDKDRSLPITITLYLYWLFELHKTPIGARFIIAFKNCSIQPLSGVIF